MKRSNGIIGWIIVIGGGILSAIGSALLTVDTSQKVLGEFVYETQNEIKRLEEEGDDDEDDEE